MTEPILIFMIGQKILPFYLSISPELLSYYHTYWHFLFSFHFWVETLLTDILSDFIE